MHPSQYDHIQCTPARSRRHKKYDSDQGLSVYGTVDIILSRPPHSTPQFVTHWHTYLHYTRQCYEAQFGVVVTSTLYNKTHLPPKWHIISRVRCWTRLSHSCRTKYHGNTVSHWFHQTNKLTDKQTDIRDSQTDRQKHRQKDWQPERHWAHLVLEQLCIAAMWQELATSHSGLPS